MAESELTQEQREAALRFFKEDWPKALMATAGLASLGTLGATGFEAKLQGIIINLTMMTDLMYRMYLEQVEQQSGATRH